MITHNDGAEWDYIQRPENPKNFKVDWCDGSGEKCALHLHGYTERDDLPAGPVSLVTHSGSVFSTLLRTRLRLGFDLAVSSGQELVTTTPDFVDHIVEHTETRVLALVKVSAPADRRPTVLQVCEVFRARVIDVAHDSLIVEITGTQDKIDGLVTVLREHGIAEMEFGTWDGMSTRS